MVTTWATTAMIGWHPILTFERRRLDLLDWIEANLDFNAFSDRPDEVGLRFHGGATIRLERDRLTFMAPIGSSLEDATKWTGQLMSQLSPRHPRLISLLSDWTDTPPPGTYEEVRAQFATRLLPSASSFFPFDASILFDVDAPDGSIQCEYGFVDRAELAQRLTLPAIGRLSDLPALENLPSSVELPAVSLYVKTQFVPRQEWIKESADLHGIITRAVTTSRHFVSTLGESLRSEEGEGQ